MSKLKVKAIRVNLSKTQEEYAKMLGISTRAYADRENGVSKWYFEEIKKISEVSGVNIDNIEA